MQIEQFPKHIFWQYNPEADLPESVVLETLLLYGDLEDLFNVPLLFTHKQIKEIQKKISASNRWKKRAFFIEKILLAK
jgi:hypothetical protein